MTVPFSLTESMHFFLSVKASAPFDKVKSTCVPLRYPITPLFTKETKLTVIDRTSKVSAILGTSKANRSHIACASIVLDWQAMLGLIRVQIGVPTPILFHSHFLKPHVFTNISGHSYKLLPAITQTKRGEPISECRKCCTKKKWVPGQNLRVH